MRYFITGGAGFIGSHFVRQCIENNHEVINFDKLTYAGDLSRLEGYDLHANYQFVKGDICDHALVYKTITEFKPDFIVNFAAETHVDRSIDGPDAFIQTNINGTMNLLQNALTYYKTLEGEVKERFRYLQISTDEVYGDLSPREPAFTKDSPYKPSSPYSASKAAADHMVRAWNKTYGLPTLITNCSNNYGPDQHIEKLIPHMIFCALKGKKLPIYGTGENIRDWIHVTDHVKGIMAVLEKGLIGDTYLLGGDNEVSNINVVTTICEILDRILPLEDGRSYAQQISFVHDRPGHDRRYAISNTYTTRKTGWKPEISWENGLKETVFWYASHFKTMQENNKDYDLTRLGHVA